MRNITETVKHLLIINVIFFIASLSLGEVVYDLFALHYPTNEKLRDNFSQADKIAKILAKKLSIKTGKILEPEELSSLLDDFFGCKETRISPFNKPIFINLEKTHIDQKLN